MNKQDFWNAFRNPLPDTGHTNCINCVNNDTDYAPDCLLRLGCNAPHKNDYDPDIQMANFWEWNGKHIPEDIAQKLIDAANAPTLGDMLKEWFRRVIH